MYNLLLRESLLSLSCLLGKYYNYVFRDDEGVSPEDRAGSDITITIGP